MTAPLPTDSARHRRPEIAPRVHRALAGALQTTLTAGRTAVDAAALVLSLARVRRRPQRRRLIAFQSYALHQAQFFEPVIRRLREAPGIDLCFVVLPHPQFTRDERRRLRAAAVSRFGLRDDQVVSFADALWWPFDLVFHADVLAAFPRRAGRHCLLPHGSGLSARELTRRWPRKSVYDFDVVLATGVHDRDLIETMRAPGVRSPDVHVVGCPFLDALDERSESRAAYLTRLGLPTDLPTIVVAPHWHDLQAWPGAGERALSDTVQALAALPASIVLKPHAMSYVPAAVGGRPWAAIARRLERPRVRVDTDVDDRPALRHGDVLITGRSSRAFNFMLLDKPVVLLPGPLLNSSEPASRARAALMQDACTVADTLPGLIEGVAHALRHPRELSHLRRRRAQVLFANPGHATEAVLGFIEGHMAVRPRPALAG